MGKHMTIEKINGEIPTLITIMEQVKEAQENGKYIMDEIRVNENDESITIFLEEARRKKYFEIIRQTDETTFGIFKTKEDMTSNDFMLALCQANEIIFKKEIEKDTQEDFDKKFKIALSLLDIEEVKGINLECEKVVF